MLSSIALCHVLLITVSLSLLASCSSRGFLEFTWCQGLSVKPSSIALLYASACSEGNNLDSKHFLLSVGQYTVWFASDDEEKLDLLFADKKRHYFSVCRTSVVPLSAISGNETVRVGVFESNGDEVGSYLFSAHDIRKDLSACAQSQAFQEIRQIPRLFFSFFVRGHDTLLYVKEKSSIIEAAANFVTQHSIPWSSFDYIVQELNRGLISRNYRREALHQQITDAKNRVYPIQVVFGASMTETTHPSRHFGPGWIAFSVNEFNLLDPEDYSYYFENDNFVDAMLAEHVLEHFPVDDALYAFSLMKRFLKPDGYMRLAVPDWWGPGNSSQSWRKDDIKDGHHVQYNVQSLSALLEASGLRPIVREFNTVNGYNHGSFDPLSGMIRRSSCFRSQKLSVIIDAMDCADCSIESKSDPGSALQRMVDDCKASDLQEFRSFLNVLKSEPCNSEALSSMATIILEGCNKSQANVISEWYLHLSSAIANRSD